MLKSIGREEAPLRDTKVHILLQYGNERLAQLKDVPTVAELTATDVDRSVLRFYALKFTMTRPLLIPPEVPADRVTALQQAFEATMKDAAYLDEARRIGLDTNWLGSGPCSWRIRNYAAIGIWNRPRQWCRQA
jgi:tripartite-type tricarboxylate transporter receptor subunit TctC